MMRGGMGEGEGGKRKKRVVGKVVGDERVFYGCPEGPTGR
jgi:hypothetical protein